MSTQNPYNSENVPFGCFVVEVFTAAGVSLGNYKLENLSPTRPMKIVERPDEKGADNGWAGVRSFVTGNATLQIATSSTTWPSQGAYFSEDIGYGAERYVITDITQPFSNTDYYKATISIRLDRSAQNFAPA